MNTIMLNKETTMKRIDLYRNKLNALEAELFDLYDQQDAIRITDNDKMKQKIREKLQRLNARCNMLDAKIERIIWWSLKNQVPDMEAYNEKSA